MEKRGSLRERLEKRKHESHDDVELNGNKTTKKEVDVIELFDDNGESLIFELLAKVKHVDKNYLVLTPFIEDETQIDPDVPAPVFIMSEEYQEGNEKLLNPVEDKSIVDKVFAKFIKEHSGNYIMHDDESYNQLSEKQEEAEAILSQVKSKLGGNQLNDAQKANLAQAANRLNAVSKKDDIIAIDTAIANVKKAMNPVHTNTGTGYKKSGGIDKKQGCIIGIVFLTIIISLFQISTFKGCQPQINKTSDVNSEKATTTNAIDNDRKNEIVGVWKGTYTENGTGGKGNLTLTINDDMTGVFETSITQRQSRSKSIKASFTVSVTNYNGNYCVRGKEWINSHPNDYSFDDLDGTVSNGIFSGRNFKLEKNATIPVVTAVTKESERKQDNTTIKKENITEQNIDYTAKVETAISKAIAACEDGNWDDAYKYYTEAASYPTDRSNQIKQTAANKFYEKAKGFIDRNGECDDFTKKLLRYANNLYSSSEIRNLLNKCNGNPGSSNSGRFPQASERILSSSDLSGLSKYDLKIMRNEIFARHGYIFTTSDMKQYFSNQDWYSPRYGNVTSMLTNIERKNIVLIQQYE